jgi:hypothetical protein
MKAFETYPGLAGFYVLSHEGQLGMYDHEGKFIVDAQLTQVFGSYSAQYLKSYLPNPDQDSFRLLFIMRRRRNLGIPKPFSWRSRF